jgi:hypothetical protein
VFGAQRSTDHVDGSSISQTTSSSDDGFIVPIPRFPPKLLIAVPICQIPFPILFVNSIALKSAALVIFGLT